MFEAIISLCLAGAPQQCRDMLLPGYEAANLRGCQSLLAKREQSASLPEPFCARSGPALSFTEIGAGIFVHRGQIADATTDNLGDSSNIGLVIGEHSIAVIDTGGSRLIGEQVYRAIRRISMLPISHVILTHIHPDHILGASVFAEAGALIVAHPDFSRELSKRRSVYMNNFRSRIGAGNFIGSEPVSPDITPTDSMKIELGKRSLSIKSWPKAHTYTDLTVFDQQSGVLFAGDLLFCEHIPVLDGSLKGWQDVMAKMHAIPARLIVPGHGGPAQPHPQAGQDQLRYLELLQTETMEAIEQGMPLSRAMQLVASDEQRHWKLFEAYHPRNVTRAYTELEWD